MKKYLFAFAKITAAVILNTIVGVLIALSLDISPVYGILVMNGVSAIAGMFNGFVPKGTARVGVAVEAWTGNMIKAFRTDPKALGWYSKIRGYNQYVNNDVIHFVDIGGDPDVLVNNTTYPLDIQTLEDGDKAVSLDKYQTKATKVTDDELYAISYDKQASVIERHKEAINEKKYSRSIHAIAPAENTTKTPVITTTGAEADGRKVLTRADIIRLKKLFDKNKVPQIDRILVLCPDHIADLLENDQKFNSQYYDYATGRVNKLYGFEVYEYNDCPYYNATTLKKVAYGSVPADTDMQASIAFYAGRIMRADGSLKAYLSEAKSNPTTQANLVNFRAYSICLPLKNDAMGAIVSAKVTATTPSGGGES